jgi:hypothetical protein
MTHGSDFSFDWNEREKSKRRFAARREDIRPLTPGLEKEWRIAAPRTSLALLRFGLVWSLIQNCCAS